MAYTITKSDGTILTVIPDGFVDTTSSLSLPGKTLAGYGQIQNENYVYLLENFAKTTAPTNQLTGQLWFDKGNNLLKVYNGTAWQPMAVLSTSSSLATSVGNLYYDNTNKQLSVFDGTTLQLVGPEGVSGYGATRWVSTKLMDDSSVYHPVVECVVDTEVVAIVSGDSFTVSTLTSVAGFPTISRGVTLKNATTNDATLYGNSLSAIQSDYLLNAAGSSYISAATTASANTIVQRDGTSAITALTVYANTLNSNAGTLSGTWTVVNNFTPSVSNVPTLGSSSLRWNAVYATNFNAASDINSQGTIRFTTSIIDGASVSINRFDADTSLTSNADNRLPTQRAVKTYVTNAVSTFTGSISDLQAQIDGLQTQINNLQIIPVGTILYVANTGTSISGFLPADGRAVSKTTYANLYAVIQGFYGETLTTFNLPDLRGVFVRGLDGGRGIDSNRAIGVLQQDAMEAHSHRLYAWNQPGDTDATNQSFYDSNRGVTGPTTLFGHTYMTASQNNAGTQFIENTGGTETRPVNLAMYGIIKY